MATTRLAVDFDGYYTNIYLLGSGLVLSEPTVAAVSDDDKCEVRAIGDDAKKRIGKTAKGTKVVFPVFEGEIVNEKVATAILKGFFKKIGIDNKWKNYLAVYSVPCGANAEMVQKYKKIMASCGINKVKFVESPILSALGQRIPFNDSAPCFVIDMAGGTTNIAALSTDGIIAGVSINLGGNKVSTDIIDFIAERFGLQIGLQTAEILKQEIGSLEEGDGLLSVVNGRDIKTGKPRSMSIKASDLLECVKPYYDKIAEISISILKKLPPEVSAEIRHAGIYLSGSASTIYGLDKYYKDKFEMKINVAENGLLSVALGGGIAAADNDLLKKITLETE